MSKSFVPQIGEYAIWDSKYEKKNENYWFVMINDRVQKCHYSVKSKSGKGKIQKRLEYIHTNPNIVKDSLGMCITWSDNVESGPGYDAVNSEKVLNGEGFTKSDFQKLLPHFPGSRIIKLKSNLEAYVFYAPGGTLTFKNHSSFFQEVLDIPLHKADSWVWMFQRWLNKKARLNTNIGDHDQDRDLDSKQLSLIHI